MNEKIELLSTMFNKYRKFTFYEIIHEKKYCLVFIFTMKEPFDNVIIERACHIHESYHKKERILKIYRNARMIKIYTFSVLNLMKNKLRLNSIFHGDKMWAR